MAENPSEHPHSPSSDRPFLWKLILTQPGKALAYVLQVQPEEFIHRHYMILGLMFALAVRLPDWLATTAHPIGVMIQLLLMGPVLGMLMGYIFSAVLRNLGQWWGWSGPEGPVVKNTSMRALTAWTSFPFALAYGAFWLVYLVTWLLRPEGMKLFILADGLSGWLPLLVWIPLLGYALYLRWKSLAWFYQKSMVQAIGLWAVAFVMSYGPALILGTAYVALYTRSISYIFSR